MLLKTHPIKAARHKNQWKLQILKLAKHLKGNAVIECESRLEFLPDQTWQPCDCLKFSVQLACQCLEVPERVPEAQSKQPPSESMADSLAAYIVTRPLQLRSASCQVGKGSVRDRVAILLAPAAGTNLEARLQLLIPFIGHVLST